MDDYGFGKCPDAKRCNVFPDGKAFAQTNDWRRRSYVYVWHALGGDIVCLLCALHPVASFFAFVSSAANSSILCHTGV